MFFFVKQKTAYEMRSSDWSSDVCSSDLRDAGGILCIGPRGRAARPVERRIVEVEAARLVALRRRCVDEPFGRRLPAPHRGARPLALAEQIGRASCRERVRPNVWISSVAVSLKKKQNTQQPILSTN